MQIDKETGLRFKETFDKIDLRLQTEPPEMQFFVEFTSSVILKIAQQLTGVTMKEPDMKADGCC